MEVVDPLLESLAQTFWDSGLFLFGLLENSFSDSPEIVNELVHYIGQKGRKRVELVNIPYGVFQRAF